MPDPSLPVPEWKNPSHSPNAGPLTASAGVEKPLPLPQCRTPHCQCRSGKTPPTPPMPDPSLPVPEWKNPSHSPNAGPLTASAGVEKPLPLPQCRTPHCQCRSGKTPPTPPVPDPSLPVPEWKNPSHSPSAGPLTASAGMEKPLPLPQCRTPQCQCRNGKTPPTPPVPDP